MHAIFSSFSRKVVVNVGASSQSQLTKMVKKKPNQSRHLLPSRLSSPSSVPHFVPSAVSRSAKVHGFFASKLGNTNLKLKFGNVMESRAGFFSSELPSHGFESGGFTGFQKRGWKSWINGANGVVFGLVIANAAVFTMWRVSDRSWMLSTYSFTSGYIHTLITSGFSHIGTSQIILNMIGISYFGSRIARTLGPLYLLKLYFAGALGGSVCFLSYHALLATLKGEGVVIKDHQSTAPISQLLGADGSMFAIALLDMFIYPKVTTYFALMLRVHVMFGGPNHIASSSGQLGGVVVAAMAWARIKKGRF
ncbi:Rhomboid-related intramembrane serine protease family protein [Arabidopsis thaliana]|uniref:Isoform 5 of Rhomboid-like protein 17, chloroplastic n=1 Tax=Arabidopsis thaliana TaxID=3702 RepID=B3H707-5|nr:Rhomboid-related intramembrane serine protease family protein [Arabidopsis thaliana]AEE35558.1 Rhomboid-related intramembrane serine protease family protein [Arabidopsis thaliana]|eukprot:NP_001077820.1 Rhomboid-related intramembrane serine protease family protein [Arabidopsis thaliana]